MTIDPFDLNQIFNPSNNQAQLQEMKQRIVKLESDIEKHRQAFRKVNEVLKEIILRVQ